MLVASIRTSVCGVQGTERENVGDSCGPRLMFHVARVTFAEYFHFGGQTVSTLGLGSTISQATDSGSLDLLVAATVVMAATVVTIDRLVWRRLYRLAEGKFRLEAREGLYIPQTWPSVSGRCRWLL
jgi:hypothetical protein